MTKKLLTLIILLGFGSTSLTGNFALRCLAAEAELELSTDKASAEDMVSSQTAWEGKCSQSGYEPYPMIMYVLERKNNEISGILHWPTLRNSKTRFKGKITDDSISFTEYELIQGSGIAMPTLYQGKVISDFISGTWTYADANGTFHLKLVRK